MKLYVISGLGAGRTVFEHIVFPKQFSEIIFLDWLMPDPKEDFGHYVERMAQPIDSTEKFCLLGYSLGGIFVQEIHKIKPAEKIVILGSVRSHKEMSKLFQTVGKLKVLKIAPTFYFTEKAIRYYMFFKEAIFPNNHKFWTYFTVRDPFYLKWSIDKMLEWRASQSSSVIQVLADQDAVFPIEKSKPDYIIKGGTHFFPITKHKEVSKILSEVFA